MRSGSKQRPMLDTCVPQPEERPGSGPPTGHIVRGNAEMDRFRAPLAGHGRALGRSSSPTSPGIGRMELPHAAAGAATEAGTRILRGRGILFDTAKSFSGLNQVLLPVLDALSQLPALHRDALKVALGFREGAPPSRSIVLHGALVLLRTAASARPVIVVLDDLPWLSRGHRRHSELRRAAPRWQPACESRSGRTASRRGSATRHRPRLRAGTGSTPIRPVLRRALSRGPALW